MMAAKRPDPLFVGGGRSGSHYLTHLLIQHEEIGIAPESKLVKKLLIRYGRQVVSDPATLNEALDLVFREHKFRDWQIGRDEILSIIQDRLPVSIPELIRTILRVYCEREFPGCMVWGIKSGSGVGMGSRVFECFPRAKFIKMVRDGRAVFNSLKKTLHSRKNIPLERNPLRAAVHWSRRLRTFDNWAQKYPANCLKVSYEQLLTDQAAALSPIFDFLEVSHADIDPQGLPPTWIPERMRRGHLQVGQPPDTTRISVWKQELTMKEIEQYEAIARHELEKQGYTLLFEKPKQSFPVLLYRLKQLGQDFVRFRP
jgi:protein-tyrosine sulfotransferase